MTRMLKTKRSEGGKISDEDEEIEPPPGLPKKGFERVPKKKWKKVEILDDWEICPVESKDVKMSLRFEVADVKKPLIAVKRI